VVDAEIEWNLKLGFGVDLEDGFYLVLAARRE
jgi:hypothetical protein